jgi:hypothetical protein
MEQAERKRAELTLSDRSELRALRDYLGWATPGVRVLELPGKERAVLDQLTLLAISADMLTVVKLLPEFLLSRRSIMSVTIIIEGMPVTLTSSNLGEILPAVTRLLDAGSLPRPGGLLGSLEGFEVLNRLAYSGVDYMTVVAAELYLKQGVPHVRRHHWRSRQTRHRALPECRVNPGEQGVNVAARIAAHHHRKISHVISLLLGPWSGKARR